MNKQLRGTLEISIASVGFGFLGIFAKSAFQSGMSVGEFLSFRFALAGALLWISILIIRPRWVLLSFRQILITAALGTFGYAFFSTLYFTAIDGVSISLAALLLFTYPFWVNIFSHFFTDDKIQFKESLCLAGASAGLICLLWGHIEVNNAWAIAAGLGAAISYAIYVMLSGRLQKDIRPISSALYVITFAALALSLFHQPDYADIPSLSQTQTLALIGIAVICTVLPLTLELAALQKLRSKDVALIMMIEPLTAVLMGFLIFNETLSLLQLFGALVIAGALITNTRDLNRKHLASSQTKTP